MPTTGPGGTPEQRKTGMMPELLGVQGYKASEFQEKVGWMMERGYLERPPQYGEVVRGTYGRSAQTG